MKKSKEDHNKAAKQAARSKRAKLQAKAFAGTLEPSTWRTCAHCGACYPYFNNYLQNVEARTCPGWFTGSDCGKKYRAARTVVSSQQPRTNYRPAQGDCRKELCNKTPFCANISSCLDLEIESPGALPLKADGSCKVPATGLDPKYSRYHAIVYGDGPAHYL